jgi:hypothetical protein
VAGSKGQGKGGSICCQLGAGIIICASLNFAVKNRLLVMFLHVHHERPTMQRQRRAARGERHVTTRLLITHLGRGLVADLKLGVRLPGLAALDTLAGRGAVLCIGLQEGGWLGQAAAHEVSEDG